MTMHPNFDVLVRGAALADAFQQARRAAGSAGRSRVRQLASWRDASRRWAGNGAEAFVVASLRQIATEPELSEARRLSGSAKRFLLFTDRDPMPAESLAESLAALGVRSRERLHLARLEADSELSFLHRFVAGLVTSDEVEAILDAWWDRDELVVISPRFKRLRVPLRSLPKLRGAPREDRETFEIDPEGAFIYWPSQDVHMGWSQFQQAVDPQARLRAQQKHNGFNERYGRAIRTLRESKGLNQHSIAGLDERTVRRIEQGKTRATANAVGKLANAHDLAPTEYMAAVAKLLPQ